jgi:hypothetical protein
MNAGKGLTKAQQGNNIIMATRRQEEERLTPEQRAKRIYSKIGLAVFDITANVDYNDEILTELTAIFRENEVLKLENKNCIKQHHWEEQRAELTQLRKVCDALAKELEDRKPKIWVLEALTNYNNLPHVKGKK